MQSNQPVRDLRGTIIYPDHEFVEGVQLNLFSDQECTLMRKDAKPLRVIGNPEEIVNAVKRAR